jgi:hypothetical protein
MLADGLKAKRQLVAEVIHDSLGDTDAAGLRQLLQARRDVDAFAVAILAFNDHIAEIDTDAYKNAAFLWDVTVALDQAALKDDSAFHGLDDACELSQQAVAHQLENAAVMSLDFGFEQFFAVRANALECASLILLHEAGVADDIHDKNCGKAAFHCSCPSNLDAPNRQILGLTRFNGESA